MSERFLKFIPSEETTIFAFKYPRAFVLLLLISQRARRTEGHSDGIEIGEAEIGDWQKYGLTRKQYRNDLKILCDNKYVKIVATRVKGKIANDSESVKNNNTRATQDGTFGATRFVTRGTRVKLLGSRVWDINAKQNVQKGPLPGPLEDQKMGPKQEGRIIKEELIDIDLSAHARDPHEKIEDSDLLVIKSTQSPGTKAYSIKSLRQELADKGNLFSKDEFSYAISICRSSKKPISDIHKFITKIIHNKREENVYKPKSTRRNNSSYKDSIQGPRKGITKPFSSWDPKEGDPYGPRGNHVQN